MDEPIKVSTGWIVNWLQDYARRYVAERSQEWQDMDAVKAQGWAIMVAAADLKRELPENSVLDRS